MFRVLVAVWVLFSASGGRVSKLVSEWGYATWLWDILYGGSKMYAGRCFLSMVSIASSVIMTMFAVFEVGPPKVQVGLEEEYNFHLILLLWRSVTRLTKLDMASSFMPGCEDRVRITLTLTPKLIPPSLCAEEVRVLVSRADCWRIHFGLKDQNALCIRTYPSSHPLIYQLSSLWFRFCWFCGQFLLWRMNLLENPHLSLASMTLFSDGCCFGIQVKNSLGHLWVVSAGFVGVGCNPSRWAYSLSVYWTCWSHTITHTRQMLRNLRLHTWHHYRPPICRIAKLLHLLEQKKTNDFYLFTTLDLLTTTSNETLTWKESKNWKENNNKANQ